MSPLGHGPAFCEQKGTTAEGSRSGRPAVQKCCLNVARRATAVISAKVSRSSKCVSTSRRRRGRFRCFSSPEGCANSVDIASRIRCSRGPDSFGARARFTLFFFGRSPAKIGAQPSEGFEIALVVAGEAHDHVRGPRIRETTEKFAGSGGGAGVASLPPSHHGSRLPVIILEKRLNPLFGAARILVDRQCQVYRGGEFAEVAPGFADDRLHLAPLFGPSCEARLVGKPAVKMP